MIAAAPWNAELLKPGIERYLISHVIIDYDGTLSWLRNGLPDVMSQLFDEYLPSRLKDTPAVSNELRRDILEFNVKPSI